MSPKRRLEEVPAAHVLPNRFRKRQLIVARKCAEGRGAVAPEEAYEGVRSLLVEGQG